MPFELDYDQWIHLDAEDLAEGGIVEAYGALLPKLRKYVQHPLTIDDSINNDVPAYSVRCGTREYVVYGPDTDETRGNSWGRATYAFFNIVNSQLTESAYRFYAINGGNDLGGMFLTQEQATAAHQSLPNRVDWPYLPKDEPPRYGQYR